MSSDIRDTLIHAVTAYDRKQAELAARNPRRYHNRNALGIYFARVDDICADIANGATPRAAVIAGFTGTLQTFVLKSLKLEKGSENEVNPRGIGAYTPAAPSPVHFTVYGSNAPLGTSLGYFASEAEALTVAKSGTQGDFGDGIYVCADPSL